MTPEQLAEIEDGAAHIYEYGGEAADEDQLAGVDVPALVAEVKRLTAERDSLKGLLSGSQTELRDAVAAWGKAERERDAIKAERDGYRQQLDTDWQARQITDLTAMVGHAHRERDEALAAIDRVRGVRTWRNEDGKLFVFADDLRAAVDGSGT